MRHHGKVPFSEMTGFFDAALHTGHIRLVRYEFASRLPIRRRRKKIDPIREARVDDEAVKSNLERQIAALDNSQAASLSTPVMFVERCKS